MFVNNRVPSKQEDPSDFPVIVPSSNKNQVNSLLTKSAPVYPSYGLPKAAAAVTSTGPVRLRMNPASELHGIPGATINVSSIKAIEVM